MAFQNDNPTLSEQSKGRGGPPDSERSTIAVLIAVFNRREVTRRCLEALFNAALPPGHHLQVFLADASSTDGTQEMLARHFPQVTVISVGSDQYWAQGMRSAWEFASSHCAADHWLWVNDDIVLRPEALSILLSLANDIGEPSIVGGAMEDFSTRSITYSGYLRGPWWHRLELRRIDPTSTDQKCDAVNGNLVLIDNRLDRTMGGFPSGFVHSMADLDYSLRASAKRFPVVLAPGALGTCSANSPTGTWTDRSVKKRERWKKLIGPKGLPLRQWIRFSLRHGGITGVLTAMSPYVKTIVR